MINVFKQMIKNAEMNSEKHEKNMEFWTSVSITDPATTKHVDMRGGFTAIDAYSQIKEATTQWGPFGNKWGINSEKFSMLHKNLLLYTAILFYPFKTKTIETEIHSSISTTFISNEITQTDDECVKKVATDALTKGLSKLGFNADVFLRLFDDNRYVNQAKEAFDTKRFVLAIKDIQNRIPEDGFNEALNTHTIENIKDLPAKDRIEFYKDLLNYEKSLTEPVMDVQAKSKNEEITTNEEQNQNIRKAA